MTDRTLGAYQRHKKHDAADFANAEFARHPKGGIAMAYARTGRRRWINVQGGELSDAQMAEKGWSPVRECPNPDQHTIATLSRSFAAAAPCSCSAQRARAEKAEQERDHWKREADNANDDLAHLRAAVSRPLTPDAITDEMVERARRAYRGTVWGDDAFRKVLEAALTEPPARPEGAEEIEAVLRDQWTLDDDDEFPDLADRLARSGVRVVGEDGAA